MKNGRVASSEIREIRNWLRVTYGGNFGGLTTQVIRVEKMEGDLARLTKQNKKMKDELSAREI